MLLFFNLATIWLVNGALNSETCPESVLTNTDIFGWETLKRQEYWWLGFVPVFALIGMFRSKRVQDCF